MFEGTCTDREVESLPGNPGRGGLKDTQRTGESWTGTGTLGGLAKKPSVKTLKLPLDLVEFMKSSGAVVRFRRHLQDLDSPVFVQLDSDMVLVSECPRALEEAQALAMKAVSVETIKLKGKAALPPDFDRLKEILTDAVNHVNRDALRANVSFFPGLQGNTVSKVRLVGLSSAVDQLRETLHHYQENQATAREVLTLPHPEMVERFDDIMGLCGVRPAEVSVTAVHSPSPGVLVSGPRCQVEDVKRGLAGLVTDTLTMDGPGAQRYFDADGQVSRGLIEASCDVLIMTRPLDGGGGPLGIDDPVTNAVDSVRPEEEQCHSDILLHLLSMCKTTALPRSAAGDLHEVGTVLANGLRLQLVFGDITHETADVVVNSTNFKKLTGGVCGDILSAAGPHVKTLLETAKVKSGAVFPTPPGLLPCKALLHVHGKQDAGVITQLMCDIIQHCENFGYKSVAVPAICAGAGGMDPGVVASALLQGIVKATSLSPPTSLSTVRLVLMRRDVFLAFKLQLMQRFPNAVADTESFPQLSSVQRGASLASAVDMLLNSGTRAESAFLFLGRSREDVDNAKKKLKELYQAHCSSKTISKEDLKDLTQDDLKLLRQLVWSEGLHVQEDSSHTGSLKVSGLKDGVNQVVQMLLLVTPLRKEMMRKEEEHLYTLFTWCIMGRGGTWERLSKPVNFDLEKRKGRRSYVDDQGVLWSVDIKRKEARTHGRKATLKRLENRPDFTLPLCWDNMSPDDNLKVVPLETTSAEYHSLEKAFSRTSDYIVMKIERVQNVHLRRMYEACRQHVGDKNKDGGGGAGEMLLYHGTSQDNCKSIMQNGFNRSFSGKNATSYGEGVYFAVKASYSAKYATPAADGSCSMFVARVLTGAYTQGWGGMRVPPPRLQPHHRFDSVVDRTHNPSIFVVFNDNQAYPDYLITFQSFLT